MWLKIGNFEEKIAKQNIMWIKKLFKKKSFDVITKICFDRNIIIKTNIKILFQKN